MKQLKQSKNPPSEPEEAQVVEIRYYKQVKPPTLKQYAIRRAIKEAGLKTRGTKGTTLNPETNAPMPQSAANVASQVSGLSADELLKQHPEWKDDYQALLTNR